MNSSTRLSNTVSICCLHPKLQHIPSVPCFLLVHNLGMVTVLSLLFTMVMMFGFLVLYPLTSFQVICFHLMIARTVIFQYSGWMVVQLSYEILSLFNFHYVLTNSSRLEHFSLGHLALNEENLAFEFVFLNQICSNRPVQLFHLSWGVINPFDGKVQCSPDEPDICPGYFHRPIKSDLPNKLQPLVPNKKVDCSDFFYYRS